MCWRAIVPLLPLLPLLAPVTALAQQEPSSLPVAADSPDVGVVVLRDGGVLTGQITRLGERYVVRRDSSEVTVGAEKVLLVCRSLDEAYTQQRQRLAQPTVEAHLALAEWCLRYGLIEQAQRELSEGRALKADHPRIALLERRLTLTHHPIRQAENTDKKREALEYDEEQQNDSSFSRTYHLSGSSPLDNQPSVTELPDGALQRFTRKIQPILVNNCTTGGCHRLSGPQRFQLDPAMLHGLSNQHSTTHNLTAVLALINREQPQLSALLVVPRRAHGGMKEPVFGPHQERTYQQLVDWVTLVMAPSSQDDMPTTSESTSENAAVPAAARTEGQVPSSGGVWTETEQATPAQMLAAPHEMQERESAAKWRPKDEFDPEIFNRKYFTRSTATQNEVTTSQ